MKRKPIKVETFNIRGLSSKGDFAITHDFEEERAVQLKDLGDYVREQRGEERFEYHKRTKDDEWEMRPMSSKRSTAFLTTRDRMDEF